MVGDWMELSAIGSGAERLLTLVPAGKVQAIPGGIRFRTHPRYGKMLERTAARKGIQLTILEKHGPGVWLRPYRKRYGLLAGVLAFTLLMSRLGELNWSVKYPGLNQAERERVATVLRENRLNEGQIVTGEKLRQAERQLMEGKDFGWVTLNFTKGRLVVERTMAENTDRLPEGVTHDLIASTDAKIIALDVQGGFSRKQAGQTVTKGEVLIAVSRLSRMEEVITQAAKGKVTGEFTRQYQVTQPLEYSATVTAGQREPWIRLEIGYFRCTLKGHERTEPGITHSAGLAVGGFALPAAIITTRYPIKEEKILRLTQRAALEKARYRCLCALREEYPDAEIMEESSDCSFSGNALTYCWTAKIRADIAIEGTGRTTVGATDGES